jgi:hypothetical protein
MKLSETIVMARRIATRQSIGLCNALPVCAAARFPLGGLAAERACGLPRFARDDESLEDWRIVVGGRFIIATLPRHSEERSDAAIHTPFLPVATHGLLRCPRNDDSSGIS